MNNKFEISLQPFSSEITSDYEFEFRCPSCKETVRSKPEIQNNLSNYLLSLFRDI